MPSPKMADTNTTINSTEQNVCERVPTVESVQSMGIVCTTVCVYKYK